MFNHEKLNCYRVALEFAKRVPDLTRRWPYDLADQLKRAMASVLLNISEGNAKYSPKDRKRFFTIALGSLNECAAAIDVAHAYGLVKEVDCVGSKDALLQVLKMLYKLH